MVFKHQQFYERPPEIEVEFPPHAVLEGLVSDALASAGGIDASDVTVTATGSIIRLAGAVQRQEEIARATEVAKGIAGVGQVRNEIKVTGTEQSRRTI